MSNVEKIQHQHYLRTYFWHSCNKDYFTFLFVHLMELLQRILYRCPDLDPQKLGRIFLIRE